MPVPLTELPEEGLLYFFFSFLLFWFSFCVFSLLFSSLFGRSLLLTLSLISCQ